MYSSVDLMTAITHELSGEKVLVSTSAGIGQLTVEELGKLADGGAVFLIPVPEESKEDKPVITVEAIEEPKSSGGGKTIQDRLRKTYGA